MERLTHKINNRYCAKEDILAKYYIAGIKMCGGGKVLEKLGQLEDLMEKYDIKDLTELEIVIVNNGTGEQAFKEFYEQNVKPYKDIEQELGIDLITLFKALKNGIWTWNDKKHTEYFKDKVYGFTNYKSSNGFAERKTKTFRLVGVNYYEMKDYGKTWALTKEELENEK